MKTPKGELLERCPAFMLKEKMSFKHNLTREALVQAEEH